jgi:hypothetical protein
MTMAIQRWTIRIFPSFGRRATRFSWACAQGEKTAVIR